MLEEKIQIKRRQLDESIESHQNYEDVYRLSVELDDLITEFYKESKNTSPQKKKRLLKKRFSINKVLYIA